MAEIRRVGIEKRARLPSWSNARRPIAVRQTIADFPFGPGECLALIGLAGSKLP
jgi:hypothetical protein